jgi:hypothetical protein
VVFAVSTRGHPGNVGYAPEDDRTDQVSRPDAYDRYNGDITIIYKFVDVRAVDKL